MRSSLEKIFNYVIPTNKNASCFEDINGYFMMLALFSGENQPHTYKIISLKRGMLSSKILI